MGDIVAGIDLEEYKKSKDIIDAAERLSIEEELLLEEDPEYSGTIISADALSSMMIHLTNVIENKRKKKSRIVTSKSDKEDEELYYDMQISEAIKEVLDCLKDVDNDLYLRALAIFIGTQKDTINIYNVHDSEISERIKRGELPECSVNSFADWRTETYVALMEDLDEDEYEELIEIMGKTGCSFKEMFKIMHEISHNFDTDRKKETVNSDDILAREKKDKYPEITRLYLSETTAILFEHILGEYIMRTNPKMIPLVERVFRDRIDSSKNMINETGVKVGILRRYEECGFVEEEYIKDMLKFFGLTQKSIDSFKEIPSMEESRKYALAAFLVPTMFKEYRSNISEGKAKLLNYLRCCRDNDFDGSLASFGIDINDTRSLNMMISNFKEYLYMFDPQKDYSTDEDVR